MKVNLVRKSIVAASKLYASTGDQELSTALANLSNLLKYHDKIEVSAFVSLVAKLRKTRGF